MDYRKRDSELHDSITIESSVFNNELLVLPPTPIEKKTYSARVLTSNDNLRIMKEKEEEKAKKESEKQQKKLERRAKNESKGKIGS